MNRNDARTIMEAAALTSNNIWEGRRQSLIREEAEKRDELKKQLLALQQRQEDFNENLSNRRLGLQEREFQGGQDNLNRLYELKKAESERHDSTYSLKKQLLKSQLQAMQMREKGSEANSATPQYDFNFDNKGMSVKGKATMDQLPQLNQKLQGYFPQKNEDIFGSSENQVLTPEESEQANLKAKLNEKAQNYNDYLNAGSLNWRNWMPGADSPEEKASQTKKEYDEIQGKLSALLVTNEDEFNRLPSGAYFKQPDGRYGRKK